MKEVCEKTLTALCLASAGKYKNHAALAMFSGGKICRQITYEQMGTRAAQIGALLTRLGEAKCSRVLLLSENCPEWVLFYFGIAFAGSVSIPLLTGFSGDQIENIASDADIYAVCLSRSMADKFDKAAFAQIPFIYIDTIADNGKGSEITVSTNGIEVQMPLSCGKEELPKTKEDDLATIIYTSGTQGSSKGVMLSGKNIISSVFFTLSFAKLKPRDRLLSVLPLAHSYECCIGLLSPLMSGSSVTYLDRPPSPSVLLPAVKALRPTIMASVPLFIEKIYNNTIAPKLRGSKFYRFQLTRRLAVRAAGRRLMKALGGRIRYFGIGGSPLSPETEKFLRDAKFPYTTGYGLTEASPLVTGNKVRRFPVHCAGFPPKGVSVRIVKCSESGEPDTGEIQVKGPNIMLGYYNDKERTAEAFTPDGWLRTGDLGRIDKNGGLFISGRLKTMILGPSGENIYPEEIESLLGVSPLVQDALVYSGKMGELVALINLSEAARAAAGAVESAIEELRCWANKKLASFSRLSRIEIMKEPFEKTPTMKIKRYLYV